MSCGNESHGREAAHLAANKRLVEELFEALSRADSAAVDRMYGEDFTLWTSGTLPFSGTFDKAQSMRNLGLVLGLFPQGLKFTIDAMTAEGDRVAVEAQSDGLHVSGKRYHNRYHFLLVIRDGQVRQFKEYMDTAHAREVLLAGASD